MKTALTFVAWGIAFVLFSAAALIAAATTNIAVILFMRVYGVH
jgi:hypothetical protein